MHRINKGRKKIQKAKIFSCIVHGHLLEAGIMIEIKCNISVCKCVKWTQDLRVGVKSCTFIKIIIGRSKRAGN